MDNVDARSLAASAQQIIRLKTVAAVEQGRTHEEAARLFGVARGTVTKWVNLKNDNGIDSLKSCRRGRPPAPRLKGHQAATIVRIITDRCPEQVKLPFTLWTRDAVQMLIERKYGFRLSIWTIWRYLHAWGFSSQKSQRKVYERSNKEVRRWHIHQYPAIKRTARVEGGEIVWGDETEMISYHQADTTWVPNGRTPTVPCTGRRFRCNMISGITNRGQMEFRLFRGKITAAIFTDFMNRLIKCRRNRVFFIVDSHPVHKSCAVERWLKENKDRIGIFLRPDTALS